MFERADAGEAAIYIPTLALVELGEACGRGAVTLELPFEEWARAAFASGKYHAAELTAEMVYAAQRLHAIPGRGDRLIAATAAPLAEEEWEALWQHGGSPEVFLRREMRFTLRPWFNNIAKSLRKEPRWFLAHTPTVSRRLIRTSICWS
jgi:hypothetical protein